MAYKTDLIANVQQTLGGTKKDAEQAVNAVLNNLVQLMPTTVSPLKQEKALKMPLTIRKVVT